MTELALHAQGLTKRFGRIAALRGIDLAEPAGTSLAVLGRNGAGKSTLLRILAGLMQPTAGELEVAGAAGSRARPAERRALVGYVGHHTLLYPELTARENLIFAGRLYGVADPGARADALLADEGLAAVSDRAAGGFSRGMAQRLAIARACVHDPPLVLLDEPFTGLDLPSRERLATRLAGLRDEGRSLVLVTHEPRMVRALCDTAIVLEAGRVVHRVTGDALEPEALERLALNPEQTASA